MDSVDLNWLAIVAAAVLYFALGALWYSPLLFVERWLRARGVTREEVEANAPPFAVSMALQAVGSLASAIVLAVIISWAGADDVGAGLLVAFIVAVGLLVTDSFKRIAYENESLELNVLNNGYALAGFLVMGAILGVWT